MRAFFPENTAFSPIDVKYSGKYMQVLHGTPFSTAFDSLSLASGRSLFS
jgi:hypothetical protein